jgi:hypothetical protein
MSLDENLQTVNWPSIEGVFKIIQLEINGKPHIRFPVKFDWLTHGGIMMEFLGINFWEEDKLPFIGFDGNKLPALQGENYKVVGAGKARVNPS